jgi:hypothetical protein
MLRASCSTRVIGQPSRSGRGLEASLWTSVQAHSAIAFSEEPVFLSISIQLRPGTPQSVAGRTSCTNGSHPCRSPTVRSSRPSIATCRPLLPTQKYGAAVLASPTSSTHSNSEDDGEVRRFIIGSDGALRWSPTPDGGSQMSGLIDRATASGLRTQKRENKNKKPTAVVAPLGSGGATNRGCTSRLSGFSFAAASSRGWGRSKVCKTSGPLPHGASRTDFFPAEEV